MKVLICLLSISFFSSSHLAVNYAPKEKLPDLIITELNNDGWDSCSGKNSYIKVIVRNDGTIASKPTTVKAYDIDFDDAKRLNLSKKDLSKITQYDEDDLDYEVKANVPALKPGEEKTVILEIKDYWIFDPDIEMEAEVDFENKVKEIKEDNNKKRFYMNG